MVSGHSAEEIVDSIAWHYMAGNAGLNGTQLAEHKRRLACPACENGTPLDGAAGLAVPAGFARGLAADEAKDGSEEAPW